MLELVILAKEMGYFSHTSLDRLTGVRGTETSSCVSQHRGGQINVCYHTENGDSDVRLEYT